MSGFVAYDGDSIARGNGGTPIGAQLDLGYTLVRSNLATDGHYLVDNVATPASITALNAQFDANLDKVVRVTWLDAVSNDFAFHAPLGAETAFAETMLVTMSTHVVNLFDARPWDAIGVGNCRYRDGMSAAQKAAVLVYNAALPARVAAALVAAGRNPAKAFVQDCFTDMSTPALQPTWWNDATHPNTLGYTQSMTAVNAKFIAAIAQPGGLVSALLPAACSVLVDHVRNVAAYSPAATHYAHAKIAGAYVTGNGYAPASLSNNKTTYGGAANVSGLVSLTNLVAFTFPTPTGNWGNVDEIEISSTATPGTGLILTRVTQSPAVPIGTTLGDSGGTSGPLVIPAGALLFSLTGNFAVAVAIELLDLLCGAVAATPRTTVYATYFVGQPSSGGTETSATRTPVTQATAWGAALNGVASTVAPISLAIESDATWYAEYSASSGGSLLFEAPLPATFTPPTAAVIPAGGLKTLLA